MVFVLLIGIGIAWMLKRDVRTILQLRFRLPYLLLAAFGAQVVVWFLTVRTNLAVPTWLLESTFIMVILGLALNVHVQGVSFILAGAVLNLVAIMSHGGVMPVSVHAVASVQSSTTVLADSRHTIMGANDPLWWMGDWIPIIRYAFSPGDVFVAIGIIWLIVYNARKRGTS